MKTITYDFFQSNKVTNISRTIPDLKQLQLDIDTLEIEWQISANETRKKQQNIYNKQCKKGIQELVVIAEKINYLACKLETLILNFKEVAVEVNKSYHLTQESPKISKKKPYPYRWRPINIWEIHYSSIPIIVRRGSKFILSAKTIDMFPKVDIKS